MGKDRALTLGMGREDGFVRLDATILAARSLQPTDAQRSYSVAMR